MGTRTRWELPDGIAVTLIRLTPSHRLWAAHAGVRTGPEDHHVFVVTRRGGLVGYALTVEVLAGLVDLADLDL